ncbi:hypothetical protein DNTS_025257, partial [Danionella cerebrum]
TLPCLRLHHTARKGSSGRFPGENELCSKHSSARDRAPSAFLMEGGRDLADPRLEFHVLSREFRGARSDAERMAVPSVMVLPLLIVLFAGVYYVYNELMRLMSKSTLRNKVVVITDSVSGVGSECARLFHAAGARLVLCGPSWDKLESLYDSLTSGADPSQTFSPKLVLLDFSDVEQTECVSTEILECFGCVDVCVCNSSLKLKAPALDLSLDMDRTLMDVNYFGPATLAKGLLPSMISRRSGQFVLVSSIQGKLALPFRTCYAASKHAVQAFFDSLRAEVEEFGISISTINHTYINAGEQEATPTPKATPTSPIIAYVQRLLNTHGVSPSRLALEVERSVNRKTREVVLAHPIPHLALLARTVVPGGFFSVVAAGVRDLHTTQLSETEASWELWINKYLMVSLPCCRAQMCPAGGSTLPQIRRRNPPAADAPGCRGSSRLSCREHSQRSTWFLARLWNEISLQRRRLQSRYGQSVSLGSSALYFTAWTEDETVEVYAGPQRVPPALAVSQ